MLPKEIVGQDKATYESCEVIFPAPNLAVPSTVSIFNYLIRCNGVKRMPLFVKWCDNQWVSKLRSRTVKLVALIRSEEANISQNL